MSLHFLVETTSVTYGGTGLAAQRLAESVSDQGACVTVHLLRDEEPSWPRGSQANLCWTLLPRRFDRRVRYFWNLGRSEIGCVVHLHGVWNPWWAVASLIFAVRKVPFAISPHGSLEQAALDHKPWKKQLAMLLYQRFVLQLASCLVVTSEKEARSLNNLGFDSIKMRRIPNVIEMPLLPRGGRGHRPRVPGPSFICRVFTPSKVSPCL